MLATLLLFPIVAPIKGMAALADKIAKQVDNEVRDKTRITKGLAELQIQLDLDQISEAEYSEREQELLEELDAIEALNREEEEEEEV
jgi:hypothetical protein